MVNQGDREAHGDDILPSCCEHHRKQFALHFTRSYAEDYKVFLIVQEPPNGWHDETEAALAFVASLNNKEQK
jgi:hypothetical protein